MFDKFHLLEQKEGGSFRTDVACSEPEHILLSNYVMQNLRSLFQAICDFNISDIAEINLACFVKSKNITPYRSVTSSLDYKGKSWNILKA